MPDALKPATFSSDTVLDWDGDVRPKSVPDQ
jgi:hypothetical protein